MNDDVAAAAIWQNVATLTQVAKAIDACIVPGFTTRYWSWLCTASGHYMYLADGQAAGGPDAWHAQQCVALGVLSVCHHALEQMYEGHRAANMSMDYYLRDRCALYDAGNRLLMAAAALEPHCYDRMGYPRRSILADLCGWLAGAVAGVVYRDYGVQLSRYTTKVAGTARAEHLGGLWASLAALGPP